ncbi:MAG: hypothetical protein SFY80_15635 [Verrucomicrobiota bacterium]|nr:hypothetical protein [Verrucomicrobiota bacterium]
MDRLVAEDAVAYDDTAIIGGADYIITRNIDDYQSSPIKAIHP